MGFSGAPSSLRFRQRRAVYWWMGVTATPGGGPVPDSVVYEHRLSALIDAFGDVPRSGDATRCLRLYLRRLAQVRDLHVTLRRRITIGKERFEREFSKYCDLSRLCHAALREVRRDPSLRDRLASAGADPRSAGMSGRQLFCIPWEQPRVVAFNPPFNAVDVVENVAAYVSIVKSDVARLDVLSDVSAQLFEPSGKSHLSLVHPTRTLVSRHTLKRVTPLTTRSTVVFHFSDMLLGAIHDLDGRLIVDFVVDLYGAKVRPVFDFAASMSNDGALVVLKAESNAEMALWTQSVSEQVSLLSASRSQWMDDSSSTRCVLCLRVFTLYRRRHHCRRCGALVCALCSSGRVLLPSNHASKRKRVCDSCLDVRQRLEPPTSSVERDLIDARLSSINTSLCRKRVAEDLLAAARAHRVDLESIRGTGLDELDCSGPLCDLRSQIRTISRLSGEFVAALTDLVSSWNEDNQQSIGSVLSDHACLFGELSHYMAEMGLMDEQSVSCSQQTVIDSLVRPVRSLPMISDACTRIVDSTPVEHADHAGLQLVCKIIGDCASSAVECLARMAGSASIAEIENRFVERTSLFRPGRVFIVEGLVARTFFGGKPYRMLLFSDLILICKEASSCGLLERWRIDTRVHTPTIRPVDDRVCQLSWLSMCFTFESDSASRWVQDIGRITKQTAGRAQVEWVPDDADNFCNLCRREFSMVTI